jgi:hypothetical protein
MSAANRSRRLELLHAARCALRGLAAISSVHSASPPPPSRAEPVPGEGSHPVRSRSRRWRRPKRCLHHLVRVTRPKRRRGRISTRVPSTRPTATMLPTSKRTRSLAPFTRERQATKRPGREPHEPAGGSPQAAPTDDGGRSWLGEWLARRSGAILGKPLQAQQLAAHHHEITPGQQTACNHPREVRRVLREQLHQ